MTVNARSVYSEAFNRAIESVLADRDNPIIVVYGDVQLIDFRKREYVVDEATFSSCGGPEVFDKEWFARVFAKLAASGEPSLLSYAQYSYIATYISPDFFKERVVVLDDNLRRIFPLAAEDFVSDTSTDDDLAKEIPVYQAEQFMDGENTFYTAKTPDSGMGKVVHVFAEEKMLERREAVPVGGLFIDPFSDGNELDLLVYRILAGECDAKAFYVKHYDKQPIAESSLHGLNRINAFFSLLGIEILRVLDNPIAEDFSPSAELDALLKRYWGPEAKFRNIRLYKNPNISSETIEVSQGRIVQTLIDEYENVKAGREYRDVFLTAPTGAGKSLLFQLPAFYIADRGDMTIVISPLIALMKDQVKAIVGERGFERAAYINSEISLIDRETIIDKCKGGEIDVIYMAPELLMSYDIRYFIGERKIGLMVIDEAHLITTWGRDFRVDYWYLGNQIRKIRKYSDQQFPMIAVTATAVYGGDKNDMVFDTVDSLVMHSPHYYIGVVKRDDIEFIINNYESPARGFDKAKLEQTATFIKEVNALGFKTLVYAPFTNHVRRLAVMANEDEEIAVQYYGANLDSLSKDQSERLFRNNDRNIMICTKAFGMGVDIPDIQVVYHHAPSGLLPDYIQEIGRVARLPEIKGYATLNYCPRDQRYSNQLYGMSALRIWQLKAVLKKLYDTYRNNGRKRNMLLSVDDFAFAFEDAQDLDQKVKTALMMIEKDYLVKYRFNVVIARPKQLFTKVYSKVSAGSYADVKRLYSDCITDITTYNDGSAIVFIDLQKLWSDHFVDKSFPVLKHDYYAGKLLPGYDVQPRLKLSFVFPDPLNTISKFKELFDILTTFFISKGYKFWEKEVLLDYLKQYYPDRTARQIVSFVLSTYSGEQKTFGGGLDENAFLQEKKGYPVKYKLFGSRYEGSFAATLNLLAKLLDGDKGQASRFVAKENALPYIRIGHVLEILDLGSFEMRGGESPMIFVRLNSPETVRKDAFSTDYSNYLFDRTQEKHKVSTEIMNHFFTHQFTNEERWNFIEDFFLGENNEELIRRYPGSAVVQQDIISQLRAKDVQKATMSSSSSSAANSGGSVLYPPRSGTYTFKDHLTIEIEGRNVSYTIAEWIEKDPVALFELVKNKVIYVEASMVYKRLLKAIEIYHSAYYAKFMGLKKLIQIPGYAEPTMAEVVMKSNPLKFYKWWSKNKEVVYLPLKDKIWLFNFILSRHPGELKKVDLAFLSSGASGGK